MSEGTKQYSHRVTIYLDHSGCDTSITTDTSEPDVVLQVITDALDSYRSPRWFRRAKSWLLITGNPNMVIPLDRLVFFKIEQINGNG